MNIIKIAAISLFLAMSFGVASTTGYAAEAPVSSSTGISETISHLEAALIEINKSDFNAAQVHLKAARSSAEKITGNEAVVKKANAFVIQGQIQTKLGDIKSASEQLTKALELYRSL